MGALATRVAARAEALFSRSQAMTLGTLPCRPGCAECCIGPFSITVLDASHLTDGLRALPRPIAAAITRRAQAQIADMTAAFPALRTSPYLDSWEDDDIDRLVSTFHTTPCPALQPDRRCGIYAWRPTTCRLTGTPVEQDGRVEGACPVQTFVPLLRPPAFLKREAHQFAAEEAGAIAACRSVTGATGDELLLPFGFLQAP